MHRASRGFIILCLVAYCGIRTQRVAAAEVEFDVASVKVNISASNDGSIGLKDGRLTFRNASMRECIDFAYGISFDQEDALLGPAWLNSQKYDIMAITSPNTPTDQVRLMLRALLMVRFNLKVHRESKDRRVYVLKLSPAGPKLKRASAAEGDFSFRAGHVVGKGLSMAEFAERLSKPVFNLGMPVLDSTGLSGTFDFILDWAPDDVDVSTAAAASLFTAIQEQLGLKLEASRNTMEVVVVDQVEKIPTDN